MRMENVFLIYFEQIVSYCAITHSNTNSLKLFCENSSLNLANFTYRIFFCVNSWILTWAQTYFTQMPLVPLVTNSMSGMYFSSWTENFCCSEKDRCAILANLTNAPIHLLAKNVRTVPLQFKLRIFRGVNYFIQLTDLSRQESLSGGVWCADNSKSFISPVTPAKTRWVRWEESLNKQASCANVGRAKMIGCQRGRERKLGKWACW